jgi:hypothetical protein
MDKPLEPSPRFLDPTKPRDPRIARVIYVPLLTPEKTPFADCKNGSEVMQRYMDTLSEQQATNFLLRGY